MAITADGGDLCLIPARELAARIARREVSAVQALAAHLQRIERHNGALNAVVSLDVEAAGRRAAAADAALAAGARPGPLHGLPMTLKDGHDVAGLRTTIGAPELDAVPGRDGTVAARLRAAGAIVIGHSNVAAWLADHQSANPIFGRTANPWDTGRTAGGSSGGAAAALAAGMTPLEVGSDMVGSLRQPAHFCGVYGLKPTEHRVPLTGFFSIPGDAPRSVRIMVCLGPMARDLGDLELALSVLAGPDGRDADVSPVPLDPAPPRRLKDLRLAVAPALPGVAVAKEVREQVLRVADAASDAGARVEECLPDLEWDAQLALFGELIGTVTSVFGPGGDGIPLAAYLAALDRRDRLVAIWESFLAGYDALLMPPATTTAFAHRDAGSPLPIDGETVGYERQGGIFAPVNLIGLPALVAPAGHDRDGLPIGVQLAGRRWSEPALVAVCRALEEAGTLPGFAPPPGF